MSAAYVSGRFDEGMERRLGDFTTAGYGAGRPLAWKVAWFIAQNVIFAKWWLPARCRPAILRLFGAKVGTGCLIRHDVRIHWPWNLVMGNDIWIGERAWLHTLVAITIEDNVCVSQDASLITGGHDPRSPVLAYDNAEIILREGCWIAASAVVLRGVTVGRNAVVGANSLAAGDVPSGALVRQAMFAQVASPDPLKKKKASLPK